jgi:RimJ/RimL family protein N-acetyltransferase
MPFRHEHEHAALSISTPQSRPSVRPLPGDWRRGLPMLTGQLVTLRELEISDAASLMAMLSSHEVARFISPAPATLQGFVQFIEWAHREREAGRYACFAVVPHGESAAVGLFQIRQLESNFATAEWGFALGSPYWGSGMFADGAALALDFAFETLGVHRLEARAAVVNGRGNGALRKIGAVQEGILRQSFLCNGQYIDQMLWSLLDTDWQQSRAVWGREVLVH